VDAWTSSLLDIHASRFQPPASASALKTHDTSGRLSQPELLQCDQVSVSLKTSRDISALGFPTCCKTWQDWVTERRGAWRQRVNAARLTKERGSSFWPSVVASEVRQGFQDRSRGMKGSQESLTTAVILHGQAAPVSSSSHGSRQGLWLTPRANEPDSDPNFAARNADRGAHCHGTLSSQAKEMWPTITAHTPDMESNGPNGHQGTYLAGAVKQWMTPRACEAQNPPMGVDKRHHGLTHQVTKQWATPRSGKTTDENPETWALRQAKGDVATMPLTAQVKCWGTPTARDHKSGRGNEDRQYKELTPMVERQQSGKLNPRWVETLMGLPIGWTMPSCTSPQTIAPMSCDSSAMELCQPPQSELSEFSLAS
jgi:hypothetical protein